jgi:hypothetical protein
MQDPHDATHPAMPLSAILNWLDVRSVEHTPTNKRTNKEEDGTNKYHF